MKPLSTLAEAVHASSTMAIDSMYKNMKAQGIDVVGFGAGEPDFPTPDNIKEACIRALAENKTKYTAASGIIELKKAVCHRMEEDCGYSSGRTGRFPPQDHRWQGRLLPSELYREQ